MDPKSTAMQINQSSPGVETDAFAPITTRTAFARLALAAVATNKGLCGSHAIFMCVIKGVIH